MDAPRSLAPEFSWTSRFQNLNPHGLNSKRYNFHQIPPSELKVMPDFPKLLNNDTSVDPKQDVLGFNDDNNSDGRN